MCKLDQSGVESMIFQQCTWCSTVPPPGKNPATFICRHIESTYRFSSPSTKLARSADQRQRPMCATDIQRRRLRVTAPERGRSVAPASRLSLTAYKVFTVGICIVSSRRCSVQRGRNKFGWQIYTQLVNTSAPDIHSKAWRLTSCHSNVF